MNIFNDNYCTELLCGYFLSERVASGSVAMKEVCQISDDCFTIPGGYRKLNQLGGRGMIDEEEELLQLAIRQSLLEQSGGGGNVSTRQVLFSPVDLIPQGNYVGNICRNSLV